MVGEREQRVVTSGVAVGPELGAVEPAFGEERANAPCLLGAAAVRPVEAPGQEPVGAALEPRAEHLVDLEQLTDRQEIGIERGRREHDRVTERLMAAEAGGRVGTEARRDHLRRVLGAEVLDLLGRQAGERGARERFQSVSVAAQEPAREGERVAEDSRREAGARGAPEEREDAVPGRQRAVHVEHRDGRARGGARFGHGRTRLYTRGVSDGPEIFDDLYLGLQAGGALRKQRRGEELTEQEREAIGRWQQMSMWRKGVAIGAFAVGTFGLGFTLGGLVFGRRARKA